MPDKRKLLRAFRKQYGLTLTELGKVAGVSQPMLSQFERGDRDLSPEAWERVHQAIGNLLREDAERRRAERDKAVETATKLFNVPDGLSFNVFKTQEQSDREWADAHAASVRLQEIAPIAEELQRVEEEKLAKDPAARRKLLQAHIDLRASVDANNRKIAELDAQGYVMMPKAVEEERDQLKARVAELEQELERERANKAQILSDFAALPDREKQKVLASLSAGDSPG